MTATDPRPALAAALAARLAPAAEALAAAYAEDASLELPPPDERARADHHRAGCAQLAHLRQLLAVLDWAGAQLPEPEPASSDDAPDEAWDAPDEPVAEPPPAEPDYDGSEDEFHYGGEAYVGSQKTPEFKAWLEDLERRLGPVPLGPEPPRLPDRLHCRRPDIHRQADDARIQGMARTPASPHRSLHRTLSRPRRNPAP